MKSPLLAALAQARSRAAPMFAKWCELHSTSFCPAAPADVARFVSDCRTLGIEKLWPAVQEISRLHVLLGLADPTLGGVVAPVIRDIAGIEPPRSWPGDRKQRFGLLPYDLQVYVAAHEAQRASGREGESWRSARRDPKPADRPCAGMSLCAVP